MRRTSFRPEIEILESREVPAVGLWNGVLTIDGDINGNNTSDWAILQQLAGWRDGMSNSTASILE